MGEQTREGCCEAGVFSWGDSAPREHVTSLETLLVGGMPTTENGPAPNILLERRRL